MEAKKIEEMKGDKKKQSKLKELEERYKKLFKEKKMMEELILQILPESEKSSFINNPITEFEIEKIGKILLSISNSKNKNTNISTDQELAPLKLKLKLKEDLGVQKNKKFLMNFINSNVSEVTIVSAENMSMGNNKNSNNNSQSIISMLNSKLKEKENELDSLSKEYKRKIEETKNEEYLKTQQEAKTIINKIKLWNKPELQLSTNEFQKLTAKINTQNQLINSLQSQIQFHQRNCPQFNFNLNLNLNKESSISISIQTDSLDEMIHLNSPNNLNLNSQNLQNVKDVKLDDTFNTQKLNSISNEFRNYRKKIQGIISEKDALIDKLKDIIKDKKMLPRRFSELPGKENFSLNSPEGIEFLKNGNNNQFEENPDWPIKLPYLKNMFCKYLVYLSQNSNDAKSLESILLDFLETTKEEKEDLEKARSPNTLWSKLFPWNNSKKTNSIDSISSIGFNSKETK